MGEEAVRTEQKRTGTASPSTEATKTDGGTRGTGGRGTGGRVTEADIKKPIEKGSGLFSVNDTVKQEAPVKVEIPVDLSEEQKREERNRKRRERYAQQKESNGETVRKRRTTKKKEETIDTTQLNLMISAIFGMIASRPNMEHWMLSDAEIKSITEPLGKILSENENLKAISEHTDAFALTMACITIFVPRILVTAKNKKEEKKNAITGQTTDTNVKQSDQKGKTQRVANSNDRQSSVRSPKHGNDVQSIGLPDVG